MKSITIKKSKSTFPAFIVVLSLLLFSCGGGSQQRAQSDQLDELKEKTTANLKTVIIDIEERVDFLDDHISEADGELRADLENARKEMTEQKELLDIEIENIQAATLEDWNDVIENTSETTARVRNKINELTRELREILSI